MQLFPMVVFLKSKKHLLPAVRSFVLKSVDELAQLAV